MADLTPTVDEIGAAALATMFGDYDGTIIDSDAGASEAGDTSAAPVDTQPRGADGKFLPKQDSTDGGTEPSLEGYTEEVPVEPVEEEPPAESEDVPTETDAEDGLGADEEDFVLTLDPDHPFLAKYGGDPEKALKALEESQSLVGRQSQELAELRRVSEQVDALRELMTLQQQSSSVDWDDVIAENPEQAVMMAVQYQNPEAFEAALEAWASEEPIKAFTFLTDIQRQAEAPAPTTLESEMESLKQRYPDIQQRLSVIQTEAEKRPALARLLNDQDPRTRAQALEDLYHLSRSQDTPDTSRAARKIILKAKADADAAKADAAVVSASNTAPPPEPPQTGDAALAETLQQYVGLGDDFKIVG